MISSSSAFLALELFERIMEWRRKTYMMPDRVLYHWTNLHLSIVQDYSHLMRKCDFRELPCIKLFYDALRGTMPQTPINYAKVMASFMRELRELFVVPRLKPSAVHAGFKKRLVVEVFISFLLQLLCYSTDSVDDPLRDRIGNLEEELRFLRTVLGDTSLQLCAEQQEQVDNLLEEFEAVANEAGSLVHSLLFPADPVSGEMEKGGLAVIFNHISILKADIMKFLDLLPLSSRAMTPKTPVLDSLLIVDSLLHDLEVLIKEGGDPIADVKDRIIMLHQRLDILQSSIKDFGAPEPSEIGELREILMQIGDMACEAEYLIISFLAGDATPAYLIIRLTGVISKFELVGTEIQEIKMKYEIEALKFAKHCGAQLPLQAETKSEVDSITIGLEDKEIHILDKLLGGTNHLQIICITGMPGLGKTTFAKRLYNHPSTSYKFDRCFFCVISQSYETKSVLLDMLINPTSEMSNMGEESLVEKLYKSLKGIRYLIVLDDIWDTNVWDDLRRCFPDDKNGSRILVTSRNKDVAPPDAIIYELPSLTNDECWDLLEKKLFHDKPCPQDLLGIGKKIAANCHGVPLAVVAVAGILSTMDKEESQWKKVGENLSSFIFDGGDDTVMQILELSYKHLPEHLKRCFLYFGAFPEYKEIHVQELMRLWIAEGFIIIPKEQNKFAESVAEEYLIELIDKNLAIVSRRRSDGGVRTCVIHDLLRDLCLRKCEEENFWKLVKKPNFPIVLSESLRIKGVGSLPIVVCHQYLRSLHSFSSISSIYTGNMKLLRVFSINRRMHNVEAHFSGIEFLVGLRYLVLCTPELPASIGSLVNLEFLIVETSKSDVVIPFVVLKMMKLRYLQVSQDATYHADCNSSQRNNLEVLSTVNIYDLRDEDMLKSSPHLRKLRFKCATLPLGDEENGAYRYPDLRFLTQLESLNMTACGERVNVEIYFPQSIKKLTLSSSGLPWEKIMAAVGRLPRLEVLKLFNEGNSRETWETRDGELKQLKFLKLEGAHISQWIVPSSEHFPRLQQLVLLDCFNLQNIPSEIGEIASLQLIEVRGRCLKSIVESAENIQEEQYEMGNEELRVIFNSVSATSF